MLLLLLCLICPPAIPFVIIWLIVRSNRAQRRHLEATHDLVAISTVPISQRATVLRRRHSPNAFQLIVIAIVAATIFMIVVGNAQHGMPIW